jgi:hypothetical protein
MVPEMVPVPASIRRPAGRPLAVKVPASASVAVIARLTALEAWLL